MARGGLSDRELAIALVQETDNRQINTQVHILETFLGIVQSLSWDLPKLGYLRFPKNISNPNSWRRSLHFLLNHFFSQVRKLGQLIKCPHTDHMI